MQRTLKKYIVIFLFVLFAGAMTPAVPCLAASAKVDLTADSTEVKVGDTINVYIKIDSATTFADFEANLVYDENILEYQGGASVITGGNGYLKISDMDVATGSTTRKYALEFTALKTGDCELSFSDGLMVYDESGNEMSVSNDALTITVKASQTASTDANLQSLETSPVDITPTFDKNTFEYSVKVSSDTDKLIITAIPEDEKATVSINGNDSLKEGENKVIVSVIAESGDVIEYTVNVYREPAPTITVQPTSIPAAEENTLDIVQSNGENYIIYSGKYKLMEPGSEVAIPEGYTVTEVTIAGITVTAYVQNENPDSDFVLVYAENPSGEAGFYQLDQNENTIQRYVPASTGTNGADSSSDYQAKLNNAAVVIALLSALSVLLIVAVILITMRYRNLKKDNLE